MKNDNDQEMKKKLLVRKNREYKRIYRRAPSIANRYLVVFCSENNLPVRRFGFSIGKKVGKAVRRNKIKRRLKEICRLNGNWFNDGYDYVFIARKGVENLSFSKLENSVENLAYRINKKVTRKIN